MFFFRAGLVLPGESLLLLVFSERREEVFSAKCMCVDIFLNGQFLDISVLPWREATEINGTEQGGNDPVYMKYTFRVEKLTHC